MAAIKEVTAIEFFKSAGRKLGETEIHDEIRELFENGFILFSGFKVFYYLKTY